MNFLNVGPWELTVILIIAILLLGPKRVLEVVQSIRGLAGKLRDMSGEFTSLLQLEIDAAEQEGDQEDDQAPEAPGRQTESHGSKQKGSQDLREVIKEGIAPIAAIQAEVQNTLQETRQTLEGLVEEEVVRPITGAQAQLQDAARETQRTVEDSVKEGTKPITDIQAELQATAQETGQAMKDISGNTPTPKEQDEASS